MIIIKKEIQYLLSSPDSDPSDIEKQKEQLTSQGYLVVTIIGGSENIEKGLQNIIRNHFH